MTIAAIDDTRETYLGDGSTVNFAYPHTFKLKSDLTVTQRTIATGADTTLVLNTDYTIAATNDDYTSGATVTATTAPASTVRWIIERNESFSQTVDLTEAAKLPARTLEDALDRSVRLMQQLKTFDLRTIQIPIGDNSINDLP